MSRVTGHIPARILPVIMSLKWMSFLSHGTHTNTSPTRDKRMILVVNALWIDVNRRFWSIFALFNIMLKYLSKLRLGTLTPVAGSIFRPLSQTHISKSEFKNGHISRFCSVFQVIQVISSAKFFSAEEVDLSFNSETKEHLQISNPSFWK